MAIPNSSIPPSPLAAYSEPILNSTQLTSGVTLTTPTSATLVTGLSLPIVIPANGAGGPQVKFIKVEVSGKNATVTAAATVTLGVYTGATSGALTTLFGDSVVVAPTGGTTVSVNSTFWLPVTSSNAGTTVFISIAATASTGNYVLNAASTEPTTMVISAL